MPATILNVWQIEGMDVIALSTNAAGRRVVYMDCSTDAADKFAVYDIDGETLVNEFASDDGDMVYSEYVGRLKGGAP